MVPGRHQESCRSCRWVVHGLAHTRGNQINDGANHMARRPKLAEFAGLADLTQHMLEQVALGVGVHAVQMQVV